MVVQLRLLLLRGVLDLRGRHRLHGLVRLVHVGAPRLRNNTRITKLDGAIRVYNPFT